ncbi:PqqD family protein [Ancylobacter sp.]|uniref:PqqD family protein n=1 Tax=Ancylobacter sp. TaxID=1872567 RepID=UPI003D0F6B24
MMPHEDRIGMYYKIASESIIFERFEDQSIVLNLDSGAYFNLNSTSSYIWNCLCAGASTKEIIDILSARFEADIVSGSFHDFLEKLIDAGLLVESSSSSTSSSPASPDFSWSEPTLTAYSDMKDLLAMDPPLPMSIG